MAVITGRCALRRFGATCVALATVVGVGVSAGRSASAAPPPAPPFTECPAVGASPSCALLLVVEPTGSITVYGDDSVGPYDGADDTLVGIINNASTSVDAVTVAGSGSELGGFDGDGLCTYVTCTWSAPTGYEGPANTFRTDPVDLDEAEVDFTDGLASGATTYFSLEGALTSAVVTARQGGLSDLGNYVAMGDSYSSGEGNDPFDAGTDVKDGDTCHRSAAAWPRLLGVAPLNHFACSGAKVEDLYESRQQLAPDYSSQLSRLLSTERALQRVGQHVDTVTVTIGGNDLGFGPIIRTCFIAQCLTNERANLRAADQLSGRFTTLLRLLHLEAPQAHIVFVGYPRLFPARQSGNATCGWLTPRERENAVRLGRELDAVQQRAADATGSQFISVQDAIAGHELCTTDSYFYPIGSSLRHQQEQAHPLLPGQQAIAEVVASQIETTG